jgi:hypothetical protein
MASQADFAPDTENLRDLPFYDHSGWQVTSAGACLPKGFPIRAWLHRLANAVASGQEYMPELDIDIPIYRPEGCRKSEASLILDCLLAHHHRPLLAILSELQKRHGPPAESIFLALVVFCADQLNDEEGRQEALEALEIPTSPWRERIRQAVRQSDRQRGGEKPKKKPAIEQQVRKEVAENPSITARQIWQSIASEDDLNESRDPLRIGEYELYRVQAKGTERLVQYHIPSKTSPEVSYNTFRGYVTKAKTKK